MQEENQLDIERTFEDQKELVIKTIVPNLMKTLDLDTYPIGEGVVYEMIHQRHRHQRDDLRIKNKSENEKKRDRTEAPKLKAIRGKYKYYILPVFVIYLRVFII